MGNERAVAWWSLGSLPHSVYLPPTAAAAGCGPWQNTATLGTVQTRRLALRGVEWGRSPWQPPALQVGSGAGALYSLSPFPLAPPKAPA